MSITGGGKAFELNFLARDDIYTLSRISPFALPLLSSLLVSRHTKAVKYDKICC